MSSIKPTPEFLIDLENLCRKHGVTIYGADYHDGVLLGEWTPETKIIIDDDEDDDHCIQML